jgi:hypothetical protein
MSKCKICEVELTDKEVELENLYSCGKTRIINRGLTVETTCCSYIEGKFYPPGTHPEEYQEDENALKEGLINLYEANERARKKFLEDLRKPKPKTNENDGRSNNGSDS